MSKGATDLAERFEAIRTRIARAEARAGRAAGSVQLLPVSKGQGAEILAQALSVPNFPRRFGENYLEELMSKSAELARAPDTLARPPVEWHYQGRLQSRKISDIVMVADVIQTVGREKELAILQEESLRLGRAPRFFLQINVSGENQKNGAAPEELSRLIEAAEGLGLRARLMGLMCLASDLSGADEKALRREFTDLRTLRDRHLSGGALSMGMSQDFEIAIEEGADWVRVGSSIFGARG